MDLSSFNSLADAQSYSVTENHVFNSNEMTSLLLRCGLYGYFAENSGDVHRAFFDRVRSFSRFDFTDSEDGQANLALLDFIITSEANDSALHSKLTGLRALCISNSNTASYPFANATLSRFNSAKGLFASKLVNHTSGKSVVITLHSSLSERTAATLWFKEEGFSDENCGRSVYVQEAQKYRIDMIGKKSGVYEVRVPILNADFSVESV